MLYSPVGADGALIPPSQLIQYASRSAFVFPKCYHGLPASLNIALQCGGEPTHVLLRCAVIEGGEKVRCGFFGKCPDVQAVVATLT